MTAARQTADWDHTAALLCKIHNLVAEPRYRITDPSAFNPIRQSKIKAKPKASISLKELRAAMGK